MDIQAPEHVKKYAQSLKIDSMPDSQAVNLYAAKALKKLGISVAEINALGMAERSAMVALISSSIVNDCIGQ